MPLVALMAHGRQNEAMFIGTTSDPRQSLSGWTLGHPRKWKVSSRKVAIRRQVHLGASHHNGVGWLNPYDLQGTAPIAFDISMFVTKNI